MKKAFDEYVVKHFEKVMYGMVVLAILSIPVAMAVGKYQVCKTYFPEISRYVCLWTNLPPIPARK